MFYEIMSFYFENFMSIIKIFLYVEYCDNIENLLEHFFLCLSITRKSLIVNSHFYFESCPQLNNKNKLNFLETSNFRFFKSTSNFNTLLSRINFK